MKFLFFGNTTLYATSEASAFILTKYSGPPLVLQTAVNLKLLYGIA